LRGLGHWSVTTDELLSRRSTPVAAGSFWPDAVARQRALVADLADAAVTCNGRPRLLALLVVARELYAVPLGLVVLSPALLGSGATLGMGPWRATALLGAAGALRWWSLRAWLGTPPAPRADVTAALLHLPGSLTSWGAALRRRLRPTHDLSQPLAWTALGLTVAGGAGLVGRDPGQASSRAIALAGLVMLAVAWAIAIRLLSQQNWRRASHRVPVALAARVDGVRGIALDGSPSGLAIVGEFPASRFARHRAVEVQVRLDDGSTIRSEAVVTGRRRRGDQAVLGLALHPDAAFVDRWSAQLLVAGTGPERRVRAAAAPVDPSARLRRLADRAVVGAVAGISVLVVGSLALVLLGYRPLVVRSGSMIPTYQVGDVVLVEQVRVDELRPGDVTSLAYYPPLGESMTHRVRSVTPTPGVITVETRGDANRISETWTVTSDAVAGRVVASVPALGAPATMARAVAGPALVGLALVGAAVALTRRRIRSMPTAPTAVSPGR
jgi:signal peptidase